MKKPLLSLCAAILGSASLFAQDVVASLFKGDFNVSWDNTLMIPAEKFTEVETGDYIYITFSNTTDVIELKSDGTWLPGSVFTWLGEGVPDLRCYITEAGKAALQSTGLELCGANFTVSEVSICNDGFQMPQDAIWGGYFWVDAWKTLEIFKSAFNAYDGQKYLVINISDDNGEYDQYFMKVLTKWDPETVVANNDQIVKTKSYALVDLQNVDLPAMLADVNQLMIQGDKQEGNPFNITSVVLTNVNPAGSGSGDTGAVESIFATSDIVDVIDIQGRVVITNVTAEKALDGLSRGIYILKGQNGIKKVVK